MNDIQEVEYLHDYVVRVAFDDGLAREIDLASYLERGPIFAPLADLELFKRVSIEGGTLCWPNGADIAPERIHEILEKAASPVK